VRKNITAPTLMNSARVPDITPVTYKTAIAAAARILIVLSILPTFLLMEIILLIAYISYLLTNYGYDAVILKRIQDGSWD
jgi:hypothetical protein